MAELQCGKFGHGFAAAGFTAAGTSFNNSNHIGGAGYSVTRVIVAAVIGGTASKLSGGKFANGAATGVFSQAFNHETSEQRRVNAQKAQSLSFNGKSLQWLDANGKVVNEWAAVSGREGYQSGEFQGQEDKGPIPEGIWAVRQERLQVRDQSAWQEFKGMFGLGTWPGGHNSWGDYRVWLEPLGNTNTYDRSGFSIHGGVIPGSAGCIDLCGLMPSFVQKFQSYGQDMILTVKY
ncbi:L,D-transpeptidase [Microbulbifer pacificus]|uniref:L,D-transpeptidase n=1 Tax=Microbulbifer pacificus TaxID=407164 RepID=UPI000CF51ED0|nr:L,D-transpeptidase [Microbulbifer pacificus]